ncbi:MAG: penicillin-binding protein 1C [Cryomorphaceae bacterium]|nr:penicillin-binding protein 1C [Cryomorphaceae bacterium]
MKRKHWPYGLSLVIFLLWFAFSLPTPLFDASYATVVFARDGELLGARTAADEQWRFPPVTDLPSLYIEAVCLFEDEWFFYHPGVNPVSMIKAFWTNIRHRSVRRGGSTISMQVVRLARNNPSRTLWEKCTEMIRAFRLELTNSKKRILEHYAAHAPFGGNIVGLEAASWRYFGRNPHQLSAAEYATLAVLPNAPGLIRPGKNAETLRLRRNALLQKMHRQGLLDTMEFQLSCEEPLPQTPYPIPSIAPHMVQNLNKEAPGKRHITSIDYNLQLTAEALLNRYGRRWQGNRIYNGALLIADVQTGKVLAYVGNVPGTDEKHSPYVDLIRAPRSSGSTLKPFLYAAALHSGEISPHQLLPDLPTIMGGFRPTNFSETYDGAVSASEALSRSLNVPMVRLLQWYKIDPFLDICRKMGLKSIDKSAGHYGLSLILGGGEVSLWELTGAYASLARGAQRNPTPVGPLGFSEPTDFEKLPFDGASAYWTAEALRNASRPIEERGWENFAQPNIAWKTGTSYGHRDAWSIGFSGQYVIGVWVGNASGEGRPGLVGGQEAAPVMFEAFGLLPAPKWFENTYENTMQVEACVVSGRVATEHCEKRKTQYWPLTANSEPCPYHREVILNQAGTHRVHRNCYRENLRRASYFVLPPGMAWYYRQKEAGYRDLPPWLPGCKPEMSNLQIIYPTHKAEVVLPRDRDGKLKEIVLKAAHQREGETLFWDINGVFQGETTIDHHLGVVLRPGKYVLTITDASGSSSVVEFICD